MTDITIKERFTRALKGKDIDKVPVCSVTQTGTVELMDITGAYWPKAHYDAQTMAKLAIAGYEIAGLEAVRYPFDNTVIAQTLGCKIIEGTIDTQPSQVDFPCKKVEDVKDISIPDNLLESERIKAVLKATEIVKEKLGDDVPIVAGMIGPAAIAFSLAGARNYLMWSITEPDALKELIRIGAEVCVEYSNSLFEKGADAVCMPDSEAGPDIISPPMFESLVLPEYKRMTGKINGMKILHMCGDATQILDPMAVSGFEGISIEEKVDAGHASDVLGGRVCLIGNVSPVDILLRQSPQDVKIEAKQCIEDGVNILAPGCGIAPHTPLQNLKAFVASRDEYYLERGLL